MALSPRVVTVATSQMACAWDSEKNLQKAEHLIREAAKGGAQIILIQELFQMPYFCQWQRGDFFGLAGSANLNENPMLQRFSRLARELQVVLPISFFEKASKAHYNSLIVFDADGSSLGVYRKSHIPDGPGYQEKFYFNPGDSGFKIFETRFAKIGVAVCWDQWFPEAARSMALLGAEILFYPSAIGSEPQDSSIDSRYHWRTVMQGHAAANLMPLVASNRIGKEGEITFYGTSFITDESGRVVVAMGDSEEGFVTATFDLNQIQVTRSSWGLFRDRRPDLYNRLLTLDGSTFNPTTTCPFVPPSPSSLPSPSVSAPFPQALSTPARDGFRFPGEYERQEGCWMLWPVRSDNWRQNAGPAQQAFADVANAIARFEKVTMCIPSGELYPSVRKLLSENVRIVEVSADDAWGRDTGPSFVVNDETGEVRGVDWKFNAWGGVEEGCYKNWDRDTLVARKILEVAGVRRYQCDLVLEGGAICLDGEGTLLTTAECLLNPNRNPNLTKEQVESVLCEYLNVTKIVWIPFGLFGDRDTNGHVDNLACFVRPGEVALSWTDDASDPQHAISVEAFRVLSESVDAKGRPFKVHKIPLPSPQLRTSEDIDGLVGEDSLNREIGERLAASYANFFIGNGCVVMPGFDDPMDVIAKSLIQDLFPDRCVVQIATSREILLGGGNIHCITQQQPVSRK